MVSVGYSWKYTMLSQYTTVQYNKLYNLLPLIQFRMSKIELYSILAKLDNFLETRKCFKVQTKHSIHTIWWIENYRFFNYPTKLESVYAFDLPVLPSVHVLAFVNILRISCCLVPIGNPSPKQGLRQRVRVYSKDARSILQWQPYWKNFINQYQHTRTSENYTRTSKKVLVLL